MRVFIALPLPKEVRDVLFEIQNQIGSDYAKIKWIAKKNLHLTMKFFPRISENKIKKMIWLLKRVKVKSFEAELDKLGFFPDSNYIRVIWVGLKPAGKILNLQGDIDSALAPHFEREKRFKVHLSLGRVKFVKKKEEFVKKLRETKVPKLKFKIGDFEVIQSRLTKDGPMYRVLEKF